MAICRIWRTTIDSNRAEAYRRFAVQVSLPMFRAHDGFLGVIFGETGAERVVITFWRDADAAERLGASPRYRETVARIEASGFIVGPSAIEVFDVRAGTIDVPLF
jgi:heme-degrading monooxygenase HmoA